MGSSGTSPAARRWWPLLLPLSYLLHVGEEWFGGFDVWSERALGMPIGADRFILLNGIVWPLVAILTVVAVRRPSWSWLLTSIATVLVVNAAFHSLASIVTSTYSPGAITGLCLYLPVGGYALLDGRRRLPPGGFGWAVLLGVAAHVAVVVVARW